MRPHTTHHQRAAIESPIARELRGIYVARLPVGQGGREEDMKVVECKFCVHVSVHQRNEVMLLDADVEEGIDVNQHSGGGLLKQNQLLSSIAPERFVNQRRIERYSSQMVDSPSKRTCALQQESGGSGHPSTAA